MSDCRHVLPLLDAFSDGELTAERVVEVRQHLVDCGVCSERVRFMGAMRTSVRRVVRSSATASAGFEARVHAALAAERARTSDEPGAHESVGKMLPWRTMCVSHGR